MTMPALIDALHNRIDLYNIPFSERGSRMLLFRTKESLFIRLAERWVKQEKILGHYRERVPILDNFQVFDKHGTLLTFETDTFPYRCDLLTDIGRFTLVFQDAETLMIRLPAGKFGVRFDALCDSGKMDRRGGVLRGVRSVAYTTSAAIVENMLDDSVEHHQKVSLILDAEDGDVLLINVTPRLGFNRSILDPAAIIDDSQARWDAWYNAIPPVLEEYRDQYLYAWWVMRAGLLSSRYFFTREALVPSKVHYVGVWHWDQFFHAIAYRYIDVRLAEDQLRILIDHQQPNGMLPDAIHDEGLVTRLQKPIEADVTKPPLMAWTVLKLYEASGRKDFLEEVFEPLTRWSQWWMTENASEDVPGLCVYRHPFSSGLDDSPLWDVGMPVTAPDLNTYLWLQARSIARIADAIGLHGQAKVYRERADHISELMLTHLWDEQAGLFNALHQGQPVRVKTPFALLPLWIDSMPFDVTARLLEHLTNPNEFWTRYPLPTVAIDDPQFDPLQMWRGPTWVNINFLFTEALKHIGQHALADELRSRTLALLMQHADFFEYYHPVTGERPPKSAPLFGWSSAVFIDLAIQATNAAAELKNTHTL
ncbi:MAG: trehalase family glycosidase [bacterium]|nr:trehalase family glycosidase [bacterium]